MIENVPLFHVRKLVCSYPNAQNKSLVINELIIPRGKLVFLLGSSGTGKSTLLETLGMMNNTVVSGQILFSPTPDVPPFDISELWKKKSEKEINELRKKHFSFIFQNTNLMENFTAYENVCLSGMIKGDLVQQEVIPGARDLMNKVKLPENEVGLRTLANNLSGGQRQRLAFVRALNNNAGVLFGDEPTGNLDETNANELMSMIKNQLHNDRTAIIVSHDVNLAIRHADIIVVMTKDPVKGYGEVNLQNIFERPFWESKSEKEIVDFRKHITDKFQSSTDSKPNLEDKDESGQVEKNLKRTFRKLFFNRESRVLFGKSYSNLIILTSIFFFTFLSIGFANGSLDYLFQKMNSAFVNWISISVPTSMTDENSVDKIRKRLNDPGNMEAHHYSQVSEYIKSSLQFYDYTVKEPMSALGRTVDTEKDRKFLLEDILTEDNGLVGRSLGFRSNYDMAFIVTKEFLKDFGYPEDAQFILLADEVTDPVTGLRELDLVPIPIRAVVNKLDGNYYFLETLNFFYAQGNHIESKNAFSTKSDTKSFQAFYSSDKTGQSQELRKITENALGKLNMEDVEFSVKPDTFAYKPGYTLEFDFYPELRNYQALDSVQKLIFETPEMSELNLQRTYSFANAIFDSKNQPPDQFSIYFDDLENIDQFAKFISNTNEEGSRNNSSIEVDQNKVKEKKNFLFLSNVTYVISFLLILFATASIGLFIYNLVKSHLSKVKMNLGTFKAIGLSNRESIRIYFVIILVFFGLSCVIGWAVSYGVGFMINEFLMWYVKSDRGMSYFILGSWNTVVALIIVLITSLVISFRTIRRILSKSPGDLIYNR